MLQVELLRTKAQLAEQAPWARRHRRSKTLNTGRGSPLVARRRRVDQDQSTMAVPCPRSTRCPPVERTSLWYRAAAVRCTTRQLARRIDTVTDTVTRRRPGAPGRRSAADACWPWRTPKARPAPVSREAPSRRRAGGGFVGRARNPDSDAIQNKTGKGIKIPNCERSIRTRVRTDQGLAAELAACKQAARRSAQAAAAAQAAAREQQAEYVTAHRVREAGQRATRPSSSLPPCGRGCGCNGTVNE